MHYEKLKNGNLLIKAHTVDEQKIIDAIITAIKAYEATLTKIIINNDGSYSVLRDESSLLQSGS